MADRGYIFLVSKLILVNTLFLNILQIALASTLVHNFEQNHVQTKYTSTLSSTGDFSRKRRDADAVCSVQEQTFLKDIKTSKVDATYTFSNESKYAMALAWAGSDDGVLIIVTAEHVAGSTIASTVYRSTDYGKSYTNPDIKSVIRKHNGLQRNPHDPKKVYLVGEGKVLYVTEDGGEHFQQVVIPFLMSGEFIFHTNPDYSSYLMVLDEAQVLYISYDDGRTWKKSLSNVAKASWGVIPPADEKNADSDTEKTIYVSVQESRSEIQPIFQHFYDLLSNQIYTLKKSTDGGSSFQTLQENVIAFDRKGKFLYASIIKDGQGRTGDRKMMISTDGGKTFMDAQIPTIEPDRFYSVMDIEDNIIFVHVDDVDDTGHGVLYTSATQGVVYSESLQRHLFPNFGETHDFYKVKSMRGVYLTSQMNGDASIHTMITYNRGATWQKIPRPEGVPCKDETKDCYLQIHGMYSVKRGINAIPPISEESAIGIVMAHGHVADALQKTNPDIFVSSDGGYSWRFALKGPHAYQIGDHGGLLVAVSRETPNPRSIKFSLDEGRCWHEYTYTNKTLNFTGLLTEPEGKNTVVMIWGYDEDKKWEVHVIDFAKVIKKQCTEQDYEAWLVHSTHRAGEGFQTQGCYLGVKETFLRLKKDAWCFNGYDHVKESSKSVCTCTREDYECDYGFYRPDGSDNCIKIQEFKGPEVDICYHGHEEKIVSEGYRKIPGDGCKDGFKPSSRDIDLKVVCDTSSKKFVIEDETSPAEPGNGMSNGVKAVAVIMVIVVLSLALAMAIYFIRKYILLRRHKVEYRYSLLSENEQQTRTVGDDDDWAHDLDSALTTSTVRYQDSDEEELTTAVRPSRPRSTQNGIKPPAKDSTNPFGSYHDDSDDDLLS